MIPMIIHVFEIIVEYVVSYRELLWEGECLPPVPAELDQSPSAFHIPSAVAIGFLCDCCRCRLDLPMSNTFPCACGMSFPVLGSVQSDGFSIMIGSWRVLCLLLVCVGCGCSVRAMYMLHHL